MNNGSQKVGRYKSAPKLVLSNILILLIGLFVLEAIFGNWFNPNRMNRLNLVRDRTITFDIGDLYPAEDKIVNHRRDEFGLRGSYPSPDTIDILAVGGSTTDQRFITDGKTWTDVLANEFRAQGKDVSVVNAGVSGQSTYGHIKNFDWWFPFIPGLKAEYFLFYVGLNDFHVDGDDRLFDGGKWDTGYDALVKPSSIQTAVKESSALYLLYRTMRGMQQAQEADLVHKIGKESIDFSELEWTSAPVIQDHEVVMHDRLLAYKHRLRVLGEKVKAFDGKLICVTQPSRLYKKVDGQILGVARLARYDDVEINGVDNFHMMQLLNKATMDVCQELGGVGLDLASEVEWQDEDFYDFVHNTPQGSEKIGLYLHAKLKTLF